MDFIPFDINLYNNEYEVNFDDVTIINRIYNNFDEEIGISISFPDYLINQINNTCQEIIPFVSVINNTSQEITSIVPIINEYVSPVIKKTIPNMFQNRERPSDPYDPYDPYDPQNSSYNNLKVFATNYNILRIMSGMAGLSYSN